MDIRIASYNTGSTRPVNVTTVSRPGNPLAAAYVQNAAESSPVGAVNSVNALRGGTQGTQTANNGGGYTDSVRGSIINILA